MGTVCAVLNSPTTSDRLLCPALHRRLGVHKTKAPQTQLSHGALSLDQPSPKAAHRNHMLRSARGEWLPMGSVIPFTLIVILPTNKRLLNPALDRKSAETERLLARWGRLHAVRSILSALALLLFLYLVIVMKSA